MASRDPRPGKLSWAAPSPPVVSDIEVKLSQGDPVAVARLLDRVRDLETALTDCADFATYQMLARPVREYLARTCRRLDVPSYLPAPRDESP